MRENKGFSLVELILSIAILSIVLTTVTSLMITGSKQFAKGSADANMQRQAQLVVNQIEDMVIDTNGGVFYTDNTTTRELVLYNAVSVSGTITYTKEVIEWVAADEELNYYKWNVVKDSTTNTYVEDSVIYTDQLLAEEISDFRVDLSDIKTEYDKDGNEVDIVQSVQITVGCTGNDGLVTYATNPVTTLRNRMMLSDSPTRIFDNTPVVEENLSLYIASNGSAARAPIQYPGTVVDRNKYYNIYAIVNDSYDVNSLVNWSIQESNTLSTIDGSGKLWVNDLEPNMTLTIVATFKDNPDKKVTGVVQVASGREIESVDIIRIASGGDPFVPKYDSAVVLDGFTEADKSKLVYEWTVSEPTWVQGFTSHFSKLDLHVIPSYNTQGKFLTITLKVSAPEFGCTPKTDTVTFLIPTVGDINDSYIQRGKYVIQYDYAVDRPASFYDPEYTIYFCDEAGNHKPEYDYLIDSVVELNHYWEGAFNLRITDDLPVTSEYYLKVIMHLYQNGVPKDYERIFYIPGVQLAGQQTETAWKGFGSSHVGIDYKLYGLYTADGRWSPDKYTIDVQEIVSNAPSGVDIIANIGNSYMTDSENNLWRSEVSFAISGNTSGINTSAIKVEAIRVKIQMKNTEIFAYSTLTFTD